MKPSEAKMWVAAGFDPVSAREWVEAGFDPVSAREWGSIEADVVVPVQKPSEQKFVSPPPVETVPVQPRPDAIWGPRIGNPERRDGDNPDRRDDDNSKSSKDVEASVFIDFDYDPLPTQPSRTTVVVAPNETQKVDKLNVSEQELSDTDLDEATSIADLYKNHRSRPQPVTPHRHQTDGGRPRYADTIEPGGPPPIPPSGFSTENEETLIGYAEMVAQWLNLCMEGDRWAGSANLNESTTEMAIITPAPRMIYPGRFAYSVRSALRIPTFNSRQSGIPIGLSGNGDAYGWIYEIVGADSHTKSGLGSEHYLELFKEIVEGTPIRTTNQSGPNTKGTRAVDGIGTAALLFR